MDFNNTNWHLYKAFIVAYETQNLHRASEVLGVSRSAVSQNLKELGNQLGVVLFNSTAKGVIPTGIANNIYPAIKNAITSIIETENNLHQFTNDSTGTIKIAMINSYVELFSEYIKEFNAKYPKVKIEILNLAKGIIESGKIDFVICADMFLSDTNYKTINLSEIHNVFMATREFVAKYNLPKTLTKDDFSKLPIIAREGMWQKFCSLNNIDANCIAIKTGSSDMTYSLVKKSIGIGFCAKQVHENNPDLVLLDITGIKFPATTSVVGYNKTLSKPAQAFVDGLITYCRT